MRTIWHSLAWKEWHEHKWKLVAITAILWGVAALLLCSAEKPDAFSMAIMFVRMCIVPLSVFVGLSAAANERSRNTLPFLQSLPAPMWRPALTKLLIGFATLFVSIVLTVGFLYVWSIGLGLAGVHYPRAVHVFETNSLTGRWYVDCILLCAPVAASFFIWAAAMGVNRKDEVTAGAVALAAIVGWYMLLVILGSVLFFDNGPPDWLEAVALSTAPGGFLPLSSRWVRYYLPWGVVVATLTYLLLATWYVRRFGRVANLEIRSHQTALSNASHPGWLSPPRRSAFTAIVWKQYRESAPIALTGLIGSVGITAVLWSDEVSGAHWRVVELLGEAYTHIAVNIGMFVALVAGIGICLNDMEPRLNTFWRSRPIQPDAWFWLKYATGLLVVLVSIYGPIAALAAFQIQVFRTWSFRDAYTTPLIQLAIFAAAVAMACLVRQAVYAAILSISVVYLGTLAGISLWFLAGLLHLVPLNLIRWWEPSDAQVAFGVTLSFLLSTLIAWLAVRNDWGWKSCY